MNVADGCQALADADCRNGTLGAMGTVAGAGYRTCVETGER
jgi:hypothetical protein